MSSGFELIIRPFGTSENTPSKVISPSSTTQLPANVHLKIGKGGGSKTFHGSESVSRTIYTKKWPKETTVT